MGLYGTALELSAVLSECPRPGGRRRIASAFGRLATLGGVAFGVAAPALVPFSLLAPRFARTPVEYGVFESSVTLPLDTFLDVWWHPGFPFTDDTMHRMAFAGTVVGCWPCSVSCSAGRNRARARPAARQRPGARAHAAGRAVRLAVGELPVPALGRFMYGWSLGLILLAAAGFDRALAWVAGRAAQPGAEPVSDVRAAITAARTSWRRPWATPARPAVALLVAFGVIAATGVQLYRYDRAINAPPTPRTRDTCSRRRRRSPRCSPGPSPRRTATCRSCASTRPSGPASRSPTARSLSYSRSSRLRATTRRCLPHRAAVAGRRRRGRRVGHRERSPGGLRTMFLTDRTRTELLPRLAVTSLLTPFDRERADGWEDDALAAKGFRVAYEGRDAELLDVVEPAPPRLCRARHRARVVDAGRADPLHRSQLPVGDDRAGRRR